MTWRQVRWRGEEQGVFCRRSTLTSDLLFRCLPHLKTCIDNCRHRHIPATFSASPSGTCARVHSALAPHSDITRACLAPAQTYTAFHAPAHASVALLLACARRCSLLHRAFRHDIWFCTLHAHGTRAPCRAGRRRQLLNDAARSATSAHLAHSACLPTASHRGAGWRATGIRARRHCLDAAARCCAPSPHSTGSALPARLLSASRAS